MHQIRIFRKATGVIWSFSFDCSVISHTGVALQWVQTAEPDQTSGVNSRCGKSYMVTRKQQNPLELRLTRIVPEIIGFSIRWTVFRQCINWDCPRWTDNRRNPKFTDRKTRCMRLFFRERGWWKWRDEWTDKPMQLLRSPNRLISPSKMCRQNRLPR